MLYLILASVISLTINPKTCFEPCSFALVLKVEEAKGNEKVVIEVDGENYYHKSDLDYSNGGPKTLRLLYQEVPAGNYAITVTLHRRDGKTWVAGTARGVLTVIGIEE